MLKIGKKGQRPFSVDLVHLVDLVENVEFVRTVNTFEFVRIAILVDALMRIYVRPLIPLKRRFAHELGGRCSLLSLF